jgi:uncharacterized protein YlxW (UPF0749 family)
MAMVGMGASVMSGITGAAGAATNEQAQKMNIQGQLMSAMGQAFQMDVQARQYDYSAEIAKYQAAVADINKKIAKQNAEYSRDVGEVEAQQVGMKHRAELSEMTAAQGASGLDVNVGSATKVRESMIELGYQDEMQTRASAAKKAYGYEVEATMDEAQADVYRYTASINEDQARIARVSAASTRSTATAMAGSATKLAESAGTIGVIGSLVGATGSVANKWMQYKQTFG